MKSAVVVRRLRSDGWVQHHVKGSHYQFEHPKLDLPAGTLRSIFRQADWPWRS